MSNGEVWEIIFFILVLKIPIVYVCAVVWYAIRAVPELPPGEAEARLLEPAPSPWKPWESYSRNRRLRGGRDGGRRRDTGRGGRPGGARVASARADGRRERDSAAR